MADFDSTARDQQRALEEMAERNDHAGISRVISEVDNDHLLEMGSRLVVALLANYPHKAKAILRDFEMARRGGHEAVRGVLRELVAFGTGDGKLAMAVADGTSVMFTELVHTAGGIGALDRAAFDALMDDKVSDVPPVDREAAEARVESIRNAFRVLASVSEMVASGGGCLHLAKPAGAMEVDFDENNMVSEVAKDLGRTVEDQLNTFFGSDVPARLGRLWFLAGWAAASMYLLKDERLARGCVRTYLETKFS